MKICIFVRVTVAGRRYASSYSSVKEMLWNFVVRWAAHIPTWGGGAAGVSPVSLSFVLHSGRLIGSCFPCPSSPSDICLPPSSSLYPHLPALPCSGIWSKSCKSSPHLRCLPSFTHTSLASLNNPSYVTFLVLAYMLASRFCVGIFLERFDLLMLQLITFGGLHFMNNHILCL